ncbi:CTP synthase, partial [Boletus coccyginus]
WVESSDLESQTQMSDPAKYHDAWRSVVGAGGILVPGGFGHRGTEGMILAIKWAREQKIPFLGICLGFQMAVLEWARSVLGVDDATSAEFQPDAAHPFIVFMPEISRTHMGGTMRLGLRPTVFQPSTNGIRPSTSTWPNTRKLYGNADKVWERHRHRYEVNPAEVARLEASGLTFVGKDERGERMQILELRDHPFFVGIQPHPEFCSRPLNPSPPFLGFVAAACGASLFEEQLEEQTRSFKPPHPEDVMISEEALRARTRERPISSGVTPTRASPELD